MTIHSPTIAKTSDRPKRQHPAWYRPTFSPEHGAYVVLFVSFLTGAAAAQHWTLNTTLAAICTFAGFQAEHPLALQIKQRRSWKPRFLFWGGVYGAIALTLAVYLYWQVPLLLWIYFGAIAAGVIDAVSVFYRQQRSILNEFLTFSAVCLAAPFAYLATTGTWTFSLLGLWLLNALFFSSSIFTVKLRKRKTASPIPGSIYHAIAALIVLGLWRLGLLAPFTAIAFTLVLLKFGAILVQLDWYKTTAIKNVAVLETLSALLFLLVAALSLLPAHLPAVL